MADIKPKPGIPGGGWVHVSETTGSDNVFLGSVHEVATGSWAITDIPGSPTPTSCVFKTRPMGTDLTSGDWSAPAYTDTAGASYATGVAVTTEKTFIVPCGGQELILVLTNGASGGTFYCKPVVGE